MSSSSGSNNNPRTVKLLCPSVSKIVSFLAWDEQRLDLGSIARTFGLDPSTVKLNGHFISRGVDLVSSSVTWRSLLNFFSAKGLSTGKEDKEALIVDGKLSKVGTKRCDESCQMPNWNDLGFKKRQLKEDDGSLLKKLKLNGDSSDFGAKGTNNRGIVSSAPVKCSCMSDNLKRMREGDVILAAPCKRTR